MKRTLKNEFTTPSAEYRGKPFWSWNGELREGELVRQAGVMKEMGLGGYFMHSRAGLITEYLGDEWFDLINAVADAAEKDGMEAWLYDEDRWPSGSAGGKVTVDPQYRMKSLYVFESAPEDFVPREQTVAIYAAKVDGIDLWYYESIGEVSSAKDAVEKVNAVASHATDLAGQWRILHFAVVPMACNSNYNGTTYIDTMSLAATERFIELTHEEYKKRCGDRLGRSIKGIFTDEPHRGNCFDNLVEKDGVRSCAVCYTDDIFEEFRTRYGYDAKPILPELFYRHRGEKVAPVKLHYIDLADHLFLERFAMPLNEWCEKNGMIFTGHVLHEDSLMNQTVPQGSLMRFYEHMGYPGVDCLTEHNRCYWIVKQLSSAARQLGKKWLLSELYGCTGWQFNFKSHKTVGDWQALFGINLRCQHLSWYTMEGESKRDYPASILHQSPWYRDYAKVEDYFARFGVVMTEGEADCDVLLLNPIESLWCQAYLGWARWISNLSPDVAPYEQRYARLFHILTDNHIDFDYGEEEMMSRMASVEKDAKGSAILRVGNAKYKCVIVSNMLTVRPTTLSLLEQFVEAGGKVIFAGEIPAYEDAVLSDRPKTLSERVGAIKVDFDEDALVGAVRCATDACVRVLNENGEGEKAVFVQVRRHFDGRGTAMVVLNTDRESPRNDLTLTLTSPEGRYVREWDLETGERFDATRLAERSDNEIKIRFSLEAAGTRCFVLDDEEEQLPAVRTEQTVADAVVRGEFEYTADEKNVCVLDYVKWKMDDGAWHDGEEVLWADRHIRDLIGIERRGGSMLQPWFAKLNDTECYGQLSLSYAFTVEELPQGELWLAGERPELNHYRINGISLTNEDVDDFWVDDCFKRMRIPEGALRLGENEITVDVAFMRTTNVEAIYLLGDFGVKAGSGHCTLISLPDRIGVENYEEYGMPFYTGSVTYHLKAEQYRQLLGEAGEKADRVVLTPESFTGGCVKVEALGKTQVLGWEPYEADVTEAYRAGADIDVTVVGTRRNVFGPLHQTTKIAPACGPGNFVTGGKSWCDTYSLIDSGLRGIVLKAKKQD